MQRKSNSTMEVLNQLERKTAPRKKWLKPIFMLLIISILLITIFTFTYDSIFISEIEDFHHQISFNITSAEILDELKRNIALIKAIHDNTFVVENPSLTWTNCLADKNYLTMYTKWECLGLWMKKLAYEHEEEFDRVLGVMTAKDEKEHKELRDKAASNGGARITLADGSMGYWKPCTRETGRGETYIAEIVSFWVDRLMGFYHTPAVVPRYFTRPQLLELANSAENRNQVPDDEATRKVESYLSTCGSDIDNMGQRQSVEGAFIGWSFFPVSLVRHTSGSNEFIRFSELQTITDAENARENIFHLVDRGSANKNYNRATEVVTVHLYAMLVGNLKKFDHNLFIAKSKDGRDEGPFVYIDNDRSNWNKAISESKHVKDRVNPLDHICKFPDRIAARILYFSQAKRRGYSTLGDYLMSLSSMYSDQTKFQGPIFEIHQARVIDRNIDFLAKSIRSCLSRYSHSEVFLQEHWTPFY